MTTSQTTQALCCPQHMPVHPNLMGPTQAQLTEAVLRPREGRDHNTACVAELVPPVGREREGTPQPPSGQDP